jgi:hypothetical protein
MIEFRVGREGLAAALLGAMVWALMSLGACSDEASAPSVEEGGVLVLAPEQPDPALERQLQQVLVDYLPTLAAVKPTLQRVGPGEALDIERAARAARAGLVVVLDAHRLARDVVDEAALKKLGSGAFWLESREVGDWPNKLGDRGATVVYTADASPRAADPAAPRAYGPLPRRLRARVLDPRGDPASRALGRGSRPPRDSRRQRCPWVLDLWPP